MLSVTYKPLMLSVVMPSVTYKDAECHVVMQDVIMLNVVLHLNAPLQD
jgi:hypothetical protein